MRLDEFRWTTRREVCEQLLRFVLEAETTAPPEHDGPYAEPNPSRAEDLLWSLADDTCTDILRKLPKDKEGSLEAKLRELHLQAEISTEDLVEVLRYRCSPDDPEEVTDSLAELLSRFQSGSEQRAARAFLETLTPADRAHMLINDAYEVAEDRLAPELKEWLYSHWHRSDRFLLERVPGKQAPLNLEVLEATRQRPESRALLIETWPRLGDEQRQKLTRNLTHDLDAIEDHWDRVDEGERRQQLAKAENDETLLWECLDGQSDQLQAMTEALTLPLSCLLRQLGPDELFRRIERKLRTASRIMNADASAYAVAYSDEMWRMIEVLTKWPDEEIEPRLRSLCLCPDLNGSLKSQLRHLIWDRLWKRARDEALRAAEAMADQGDGHWAKLAAIGMERHPRRGDRGFLLWAARQESFELRYTAVQALELMGEDSAEWRERLTLLAKDAHPAIRLHALAALVRRVDDSRLPEIVNEARSAEDVRVRAEAIRMLGELDARRHLPLLVNAVRTDHEIFDGYYVPVAEEAALVLAQTGGSEPWTALVQAALVGPERLWASIRFYADAVDPPQGPETRLTMFLYGNWRQARPWRD